MPTAAISGPGPPGAGRVPGSPASRAPGCDNDSFRYEAVALLRQAVGFDWWCWPLIDPGTRLPTRYVGVESAVDRDYRRFCRLLIGPGAWGDLGASAGGRGRRASQGRVRQVPVAAAISTATSGDLSRDPLWREMLGPAGAGDVLNVMLAADGACWGQLHLGRDKPGRWFSEDDERLLAELAPLIAARLRAGLRTPPPSRGGAGRRPGTGTGIRDDRHRPGSVPGRGHRRSVALDHPARDAAAECRRAAAGLHLRRRRPRRGRG